MVIAALVVTSAAKYQNCAQHLNLNQQRKLLSENISSVHQREVIWTRCRLKLFAMHLLISLGRSSICYSCMILVTRVSVIQFTLDRTKPVFLHTLPRKAIRYKTIWQKDTLKMYECYNYHPSTNKQESQESTKAFMSLNWILQLIC